MMKLINLILLISIPFLFASCEKNTNDDVPTLNKKLWDEGRYCSDYLKFECLPESRNPEILNGNEPLADGKYPFYEYDQKRFDDVVEKIGFMDDRERKIAMGKYKLTQADYEWMEQVRLKQWYKEMEATMEKHYPGFWGDTPRPVRHRWMRLCVAKGHKYGYGLLGEVVNDKGEVYDAKPGQDISDFHARNVLDKNGKPQPYMGANPEMQQWIELCARIGLYFDLDPKWKYLLDYVKINKDGICAGMACLYIDFVVYKKDFADNGMIYDNWVMQETFSLPYPKDRPVPRSEHIAQAYNALLYRYKQEGRTTEPTPEENMEEYKKHMAIRAKNGNMDEVIFDVQAMEEKEREEKERNEQHKKDLK